MSTQSKPAAAGSDQRRRRIANAIREAERIRAETASVVIDQLDELNVIDSLRAHTPQSRWWLIVCLQNAIGRVERAGDGLDTLVNDLEMLEFGGLGGDV